MRVGLTVIALYVCGTGYLTYAAFQRTGEIELLTGETHGEVCCAHVCSPCVPPTCEACACSAHRHFEAAVNAVPRLLSVFGECAGWQVMTEIALEGAKCLSNLVVLYHGLALYCAQPNDTRSAKGAMV